MTNLINHHGFLTVVPNDVIYWEICIDGQVPHGAVVGGKSIDNELLYVGRTRLLENRYELTPGFIIPSKKCLIVSYGTGMRIAKEFEVLVTNDENSVHWISCSRGYVPNSAVIGGIDCSYEEPLYIGRTRGNIQQGKTWRGRRLKLPEADKHFSDDVHIPGKVHRTHKCLYIPYMGKEYLFREYEVLALKASPASLLKLCKISIRDALSQNLKQSGNCLRDEDESSEDLHSFMSVVINRLALPRKLKDYCIESSSDH